MNSLARADRTGRAAKRSGPRNKAQPAASSVTRYLLRPLDSARSETEAERLDRVAEGIRGILGRTLARGMDEVGNYLLRAFYNDDPALYRDPRAPNHISLRALAARCGTLDLPVSTSFVSTSIRIAAVGRTLPAGASFLKLPMSHRAELVRLPHDKIESEAAFALRDATPVRELRDRVSQLLPAKGSNGGRPPTPRVMRVVSDVRRAMKHDAPRAITPSELAMLSAKQREELDRTLTAATEYITALHEALRQST